MGRAGESQCDFNGDMGQDGGLEMSGEVCEEGGLMSRCLECIQAHSSTYGKQTHSHSESESQQFPTPQNQIFQAHLPLQNTLISPTYLPTNIQDTYTTTTPCPTPLPPCLRATTLPPPSSASRPRTSQAPTMRSSTLLARLGHREYPRVLLRRAVRRIHQDRRRAA